MGSGPALIASPTRFGALVAGSGLLVSAFLPWIDQEGVTISGIERGGWPLVVAGSLLIAVAVIGVASKGAKVLLIGAPTIGLLGALAGLADVIRLEGEDAPIGPGLIGALIISVVALLAAFVLLYRRSGAAPV